ncbi:M20 metallopeptidase family protein [Massilia horti]|uniref:M20 metallopeptidase family protein n=1 Tax=Massilia horti TaxID=2562153 RepID=UPI00142F85E8|nr:M20 family metallopeptidase [Massilia horti]
MTKAKFIRSMTCWRDSIPPIKMMHLTTFDFELFAGFVKTAALALLLAGAAPAEAQDVRAAISGALPVARDAYAYLHTNPELGKKELLAHTYIDAKLRKLGFTQFVTSASAPTAVITVFDTGRPGHTIALRAEMDARPLADNQSEPASHSPRSAIPGVMHNCGHDVHASILLATAALIRTNADHFKGKIVFLFQPAEEVAGGADDIVKDRILEQLGVERIFALHSAPGMPVRTIGLTPGAILAGSNYFTLTLSGRGSHAAAPQDGDDVLLSAMRVAQGLSYAPAREIDIAARPMVLSITKFAGDSGATNVLPSSVEIKGTIRAFEDLTKDAAGAPSLEKLLVDRIGKMGAVYGLHPKWELRPASPPTSNDPALFAKLAPLLTASYSGHVETGQSRGMFSEDFAYYTPIVPALYASLGIAKDGLGTAGVHSMDFTIHPDALSAGIELMIRFAEFGTSDTITWR